MTLPAKTNTRRLSSRRSKINKRFLPPLWFGFLAFIAWAMIAEGGPQVEFLLIALFLGIGGYLLMRWFVFDLVDEVWDAGDVLIVKNNNQEERIPFSAIAHIGHSSFFSPTRVTLTLNAPSQFGEKIAFSPPIGFSPFAKNAIAVDLIERLEAKRHAVADEERTR